MYILFACIYTYWWSLMNNLHKCNWYNCYLFTKDMKSYDCIWLSTNCKLCPDHGYLHYNFPICMVLSWVIWWCLLVLRYCTDTTYSLIFVECRVYSNNWDETSTLVWISDIDSRVSTMFEQLLDYFYIVVVLF